MLEPFAGFETQENQKAKLVVILAKMMLGPTPTDKTTWCRKTYYMLRQAVTIVCNFPLAPRVRVPFNAPKNEHHCHPTTISNSTHVKMNITVILTVPTTTLESSILFLDLRGTVFGLLQLLRICFELHPQIEISVLYLLTLLYYN